MGLFYQPRMMMDVESEVTGEIEVLEVYLPQCHFVHHKSHMTCPGIEPGPLLWEACD
jgi:hypothetical protein